MEQRNIPEALRSRLIGNPKSNGEWDMRCPLIGHDDAHRSASLNIKKDQWYCFACAKGGNIDSLLTTRIAEFENEEEVYAEFSGLPSELNADRYHKALLSNRPLLKQFQRDRGISLASIKRFKIGWDQKALKGKGAFTIPIYDAQGELANIRSYNKSNEPKIWSIAGHGTPRLFPLDELKTPGPVVIAEGEWDTILTIQNGFRAVTRTGAADVWKPAWTSLFKGRSVYLCHDADSKGQEANKKLVGYLSGIAESVLSVSLPYPVEEKHGKDLTDYFHVDRHTPEDFKDLLQDSKPFGRIADAQRVTLTQSLDSEEYWNRALTIPGRVRGKSQTPQAIPAKLNFTCDHSMGEMCEVCGLNEAESLEAEIPRDNPAIVDFLEMGQREKAVYIRNAAGVYIPPKCTALQVEELSNYRVASIDIRPSLKLFDFSNEHEVEVDTSRHVMLLSSNTIKTNEVIDFTGYQHRTAHGENVFVAYRAERSKDDIDMFQTTDQMVEHCIELQAKPEDSLEMILQIGNDLSAYTGIIGRPLVHAMFDLVWHSAITFKYEGRYLPRGWLECLLLGETRTGKSEVALQMRHLYDLGEFVSCESTTPAGITGGLVQRPNAGWSIQLGAFPFNDRGLVILDEVSGLSQDQISQLTEMRSSGILKITKIENEQAMARVRSIWMSNPRTGGYMQGVNGIADIIGKPEDISRFDMAFSVQTAGVPNVNAALKPSMPMFRAESYRALVRWAWTRRKEEIIVTKEAEAESRTQAVKMAQKYVPSPPLILASDVRVKLIRLAVAIAQRTFSTRFGTQVLVTSKHVLAAVKFLELLYDDDGFGYGAKSAGEMGDSRVVYEEEPNILQMFGAYSGLKRFLMNNGMKGFRSQDLREVLGVTYDEAIRVNKQLEDYNLIERSEQASKLTVAGIELLRRTV